jgi:hypothetical protein
LIPLHVPEFQCGYRLAGWFRRSAVAFRAALGRRQSRADGLGRAAALLWHAGIQGAGNVVSLNAGAAQRWLPALQPPDHAVSPCCFIPTSAMACASDSAIAVASPSATALEMAVAVACFRWRPGECRSGAKRSRMGAGAQAEGGQAWRPSCAARSRPTVGSRQPCSQHQGQSKQHADSGRSHGEKGGDLRAGGCKRLSTADTAPSFP